jgi:hypothetical protein
MKQGTIKNNVLTALLFCLTAFILPGCMGVGEDPDPNNPYNPNNPAQSYKIYANGSFSTDHLDTYNWESHWNMETQFDTAFPAAGHSAGSTKVIKMILDNTSGDWLGWSIILSTGVSLQNVNALSYWVKNSGTTDITLSATGFGASDSRQVEYNGENPFTDGAEGSGIMIPGDGAWHNVIVPVPEQRNVTITNPFYICSADVFAGKILYVDDIEFITAEGLSLASINIPPSKSLASDGVNADVLGRDAKAVFKKKDNSLITLFNRYTASGGMKLFNWGIATVTGPVTQSNGLLTPSAPSGDFTYVLKIGSVTSNTMNGSIGAGGSAAGSIYSNGVLTPDYTEHYRWSSSWGPENIILSFTEPGHSPESTKVIKTVLSNAGQGWTGWAIMLGEGINLSEVNALSYWVKNGGDGIAESDIIITATGFGADGVSGDPYQVEYAGEIPSSGILIPNDGEWHNVIVPVPAQKNIKIINPFYLTTSHYGDGRVLYIDDIEFKTVAGLAPFSMETPAHAEAVPGVANAVSDMIGNGKTAVFKKDGDTYTLKNNFKLGNWCGLDDLPPGWSETNGILTIPANETGSFNCKVALGSLKNNITIGIVSSKLIDDFEGTKDSGCGGYGGNGASVSPGINWNSVKVREGEGNKSLEFTYSWTETSGWTGFWHQIDKSFSGFNTFSFWLYLEESQNSETDVSNLKYEVTFTTPDQQGKKYLKTLTGLPLREWQRIEIPIGDFKYQGGSMTSGEQAHVFSYSLYVSGFQGTGGSGKVYIDTVRLENK